MKRAVTEILNGRPACMRGWATLVVVGIIGISTGLAQVPEQHRGPAPQDVIIQAQPDQPLVIPAGIVGWIAASAFGTILGLGGIIYKRHKDDIEELKQNDLAMGMKIDRHYETIIGVLLGRK